MELQTSQLLPVWREVCRHLQIHESTENIAEHLAGHMPLERLTVRQLDPALRSILTVAAAPLRAGENASEDRRVLSVADWRRVCRWCTAGRALRRGARGGDLLPLMLPSPTEADSVAIPLSRDDEPAGVLLVAAAVGAPLSDGQIELIEGLGEPFSAALQNDRRLHEMARLREAAEAERGALLRRLGRTDLSDRIVGENSGLRHVIERIDLVSHSDVPVLVLGETGTGKELVARAIHARSQRRAGPFIRVNCGAIPAELIDSQLFGHERGSFTGAEQTRAGWFERADGGTLFLDEIGELPLEAQVRFLRVLQDGFVERVGGAHPVHVDVRIVAATHRDLAQMVRESEFREDLWYRLAVFPILLPPLRERRDDIPELAHHFAERAALRFGLAPSAPTTDDLQLLQSYDWPGNIRELGTVIDRAAILGNGHGLQVSKALGWTQTGDTDWRPTSVSGSAAARTPSSHDKLPPLNTAIRTHIELALQQTHGRIEGRQGAAELLGINPHTLRAKMRKLGLDWSQFRRLP